MAPVIIALVRATTYLITFQQTAFAAYDIGQEGSQRKRKTIW